MKTNTAYQQIPARFSTETRFELTPRLEARRRDATQATFEQLKSRLLQPRLAVIADPTLLRELRLAANEAAAIAWTTDYPLLVLPALLEEKLEEVRQHAARQRLIQVSSRLLTATEA